VIFVAKDVVCGMQVDEQEARSKGLTSEYQGQTYYFCGAGCKRQFERDPQAFVGPGTGSTQAGQAGH
jgi:Cu+-exporting ATPase